MKNAGSGRGLTAELNSWAKFEVWAALAGKRQRWPIGPGLAGRQKRPSRPGQANITPPIMQ